MQKLFIISGGSRGLGLSLVAQALEAGWRVVELSRHGAMKHAKQCPTQYQHIFLDLARADEGLAGFEANIQELASQTWQEVVFVNNAAMVGPIVPVALLEDSALQDSIAVNFTGALRLITIFVRHFEKHSAPKTLLNISSGAALHGYPSWSLYCAAKAGMENFIRSLAQEQIGKEVPIACANFGPGVMDTDMQQEIRSTAESMFREVARFQKLKDDKQLRLPSDVARAVFILLGDGVENSRRYVVDEFDGRLN